MHCMEEYRMYKYNENKQLAVARRAIDMARKSNYDFNQVKMNTEKSKSFSDFLHKDMSSNSNHEFVE